MSKILSSVLCCLVAAFLTVIANAVAFAEEEPNVEGIELSATEGKCASIVNKNASGEPLSPSEGDMLVICFFPKDLDGSVTGPGFQAYQPPPSLYDMQNFDDIPGVLGGGMANG